MIIHTVLEKHEQYLGEIKSLTLFDDGFMYKIFEDGEDMLYVNGEYDDMSTKETKKG